MIHRNNGYLNDYPGVNLGG